MGGFWGAEVSLPLPTKANLHGDLRQMTYGCKYSSHGGELAPAAKRPLVAYAARRFSPFRSSPPELESCFSWCARA